MIAIHAFNDRDIPLGLELCRFAGWNQLAEDWRRLLALGLERVFVAECEGRPCATASIVCYGAELGWIGMILVHPEYRRRGIAGALMQHCLDRLDAAQVPCAKLDATEAGRQVYLKIGFEDERPICRYTGPAQAKALACALPRIEAGDWEGIARLDFDAFGAVRLRLLQLLAKDGDTALAKTGREIRGYGFARRGHNASFLGPLVADGPGTARRLAAALLAGLPRGEVYWDALPDNAAAHELAESLGFRAVRHLVRMHRGAPVRPGTLAKVYAAAGFEMG